MTDRKKEFLAVAAVLLFGLALRLWGIDWGLPYEYQTEEHKVVKYALRMGGGDLNPHFFEYPSLYLYFMLAAYGFYFVLGRAAGIFASVQDFSHLFIKDPTSFYLIGRVFESLFGLAVVFLCYRIGKKIFSTRVGLLAAFSMAVLPSAVNTGHVVKGDMAAIFLGLLFWYSAYLIQSTGEKRYYWISGILFGLTVSTKYYLAPLGIVLPLAHFLREERKPLSWLLLSLALIPLFFVLGTPYAVLNHAEFAAQMRTVSENFTVLIQAQPYNFVQRLGITLVCYIKMIDGISWIPMGLAGLLGLGTMFWKKEKSAWLFAAPVLVFLIGAARSWAPRAGYLAPTFPLLILAASYLAVSALSGLKAQWSVRIVYAAFLAACIAQSARVGYSYTLPDTRTLAKIWTEENIPPGSRILIDSKASSPPFLMHPRQVRKFYEKAAATGNYKKDYFRLLAEVYGEENKGYEIFMIKKNAMELAVLSNQLRQTQETQDLIPIAGTKEDFDELKKDGIEYVVVNSWDLRNAKANRYEWLENFYRNLAENARMVKEFIPPSELHPGPEIRIYAVAPTAR